MVPRSDEHRQDQRSEVGYVHCPPVKIAKKPSNVVFPFFRLVTKVPDTPALCKACLGSLTIRQDTLLRSIC